jgi:hypothetical protein
MNIAKLENEVRCLKADTSDKREGGEGGGGWTGRGYAVTLLGPAVQYSDRVVGIVQMFF